MPRREQPLPSDGSPLVEFAIELRKLRDRAGTPSYRALAERANYSPSTLAAAAGGQSLPSLAVTLAFVAACGGDAGEWEQRWRALAVAESGPPVPETGEAPYVGLAAFGDRDADRFFGRDRLSAELRKRVAGQRFVAVFGASGAGKSSLLNAGLRAHLESAPVVVLTPGAHPLAECAAVLAPLLGQEPRQVLTDLRADRRGLYRLARQVAETAVGDLVLVVDQFEELFTLCADAAERSAFVAALHTAVTAERATCRVVLGVRADFYAHCTGHPELVELLRDSVINVGSMSAEETRKAILAPARLAGCAVENALLTHLVAETANRPGVLPLLSHALLETWRRRKGNTLALSGFQAAGGLDGAVARSAEAAYTALTAEQQRLARHLFRRLTAPGEGTEDTKRRIPSTELDAEGIGAVIESFTAARLLVLDHGTLEITHEALLVSWPRLRGWLAEDRDGLRVHRQLTEAAQIWESLGREDGALYRGTRLARAADWARDNPDALNGSEAAFLERSSAAASSEQARLRRHNRRLRVLAAALAVFLVASAGATVFALRQQADALSQQQVALSRQLAAQAEVLLSADPLRAGHLGLAAYAASPTNEARSLLLSLAANPEYQQRPSINARVSATFSPDERQLVLTNQHSTGEIALWDLATRTHRNLPHPAGEESYYLTAARAAAYLPGGDVAVLYASGRIGRWDPAANRSRTVLASAPEPSERIAATVDDNLVWTLGSSGQLRLWDLAGGHLLHALPVRSDVLATSRDGRLLATSDRDTGLRLWDAVTGAQSALLATATTRATAMAFDPTGRFLAIGRASGEAEVWDVRGRFLIRTFAGHTGPVDGVGFGAAQGIVLVTDATGRLTVRHVSGAEPLLTVAGGPQAHHGLASPSGAVFVAASGRGTVFWDRTRLPLLTEPNPAPSRSGEVANHPYPLGAQDDSGYREASGRGYDERVGGAVTHGPSWRTVAGIRDGKVRLWHTDKAELLGELPTTDARATVFDHTGERIAVVEPDRVSVWRFAEGRKLIDLTGHRGFLLQPAFEPGSDRLTGLTEEGRAMVWNTADGSHFSPPTTGAISHALSPSGDRLVLGTRDRLVVWNLTTRAQEADIHRLHGRLRLVAIHPEHTALAAVGEENTIELWDARTGERTATLRGATSPIRLIHWDVDGKLRALTRDQMITWELDPQAATGLICARLRLEHARGSAPAPAECG